MEQCYRVIGGIDFLDCPFKRQAAAPEPKDFEAVLGAEPGLALRA